MLNMEWFKVLLICCIMNHAVGNFIVEITLPCERISYAIHNMRQGCTSLALPIINYISYTGYYHRRKNCYRPTHNSPSWEGNIPTYCIDMETGYFDCMPALQMHCQRDRCANNLSIFYVCQPTGIYPAEPSSTQLTGLVTSPMLLPTASAGNTGGQVDTNGDQESKQDVNRNEVVVIVATICALVAAALIVIGAFIVHRKWKPLKRLRVRPAWVDNLYIRPPQIRHTSVPDRPIPHRPFPDQPLPDPPLPDPPLPDQPLPEPPLPDQPLPDPPLPDLPRDNTEWMSIREVQNLQVPISNNSPQGQTDPGLAEGQESPPMTADKVDGHPRPPDFYANIPGHGSQRPAAPGIVHYDVAAEVNLDNEDSASYENIQSPKDSLPALPPRGLRPS